MNYYEILGVSVTASQDDIITAFRSLRAQAHPDHGGTPEAFDRLARAYQTLRDPISRREYDQIEGIDNASLPAIIRLQKYMIQIVEMTGFENVDYIQIMRSNIENGLWQLQELIKSERVIIKRLTKAQKTIVRRHKGPNIFSQAIQKQIKKRNDNVADFENERVILQEMQAILDNYTCETIHLLTSGWMQ